jgi:multiple sugar transport system substrate-binding protein
MRKKGVVLLLGFVVAIGIWWITRSDSLAQPSEGVVDVWATWGDDAGYLQSLFDRFGGSGGVPVRVTSRVRSDDLLEALAGGERPDLVILSSSDLVGAYAGQGLVEPLDGWIEATGIDLEDLYAAPLVQCKGQDGSTFCLPWGCDVDALYWNKDLFAAAGLDPESPPQTMEEMVEYANALAVLDEAGELSQVGFVPDFFRSHTNLYARMLASDNGAGLTGSSQPVIDAQEWERQFYNTYTPEIVEDYVSSFTPYMTSRHPLYAGRRLDCQQCHRSSPIRNEKAPGTGLYGGRVAMMVDAQWHVLSNALSREELAGTYGVAPFPPPFAHPERAKTTLVQGPVVLMPEGAVDKEAAASLLAWIMSPEVVAEMAHATSSLPTSRLAARDPRFQEIPFLEVFMDLVAHPNARPAVDPESQTLR